MVELSNILIVHSQNPKKIKYSYSKFLSSRDKFHTRKTTTNQSINQSIIQYISYTGEDQ